MRLVHLDHITEEQSRELIAGERKPWGDISEQLVWREKERTVGIRSPDGRLLAVAGTVLAEVAVGSLEPFRVLGVGGVFVTRAARGRGLVARLLAGLLDQPGRELPERAMLFCRSQLAPMYEKLGFRAIAAPVSADQPAGRIVMPLEAMWRPLRTGAAWPGGDVEVRGLPF